MNGVDLIRAERRRQRSRSRGREAYSLGHDDEHDKGEIARAAAIYAIPPDFRARNGELVGALHPFGWYLKLQTGDRVRELVKAGALIAAEIDRLLRAEAADSQQEAKERSDQAWAERYAEAGLTRDEREFAERRGAADSQEGPGE